jgi:hypothetical protein
MVEVGVNVGVGVSVGVGDGVAVAVPVALAVNVAVCVEVVVEVKVGKAVADGGRGVSITTTRGTPDGAAPRVRSGTATPGEACAWGSNPSSAANCRSPCRSSGGSVLPRAASLAITREAKVSPQITGMRARPRRTVFHREIPVDWRARPRCRLGRVIRRCHLRITSSPDFSMSG